MIKVDIVNEVSKIADITKVKAEVAVDAVFDAMRTSMQRGERIELRGFGVFQVKPRKRGLGRNPRTGKEVRIPPGRTIRFKPGKDLQNIGSVDPVPVWRPRPKFQDRRWLHALLFLLTIGSTALVGGWAHSAAILAILGCRVLGHYVPCRYYDVDASLPFFLPVPITLTGTLGAFIRIREPIPYKRWLFDIGIAGALAGFFVAVPALFVGVAMSTIVPLNSGRGLMLGDPLLMKLAAWLIWGPIDDAHTLLLHPVAFAAWFGLL